MTEGVRRRRRARRRRRPGPPQGGAAAAAPISEKDTTTAPPAGGRPAPRPPSERGQAERIAALDLGTNNCRLLIASARGGALRIVDAFSRIVRLGEGVAQTGVLSPAAMQRALEALEICAGKIARRGVSRGRYIATQACRAASNGEAFLAEVKKATGLEFEIIAPAEEARLSVRGCIELLDPDAEAGLVFDIGGGSTEISWIVADGGRPRVVAWASFPLGVVNLSEAWGGREISAETYERIVDSVRIRFRAHGDPAGLKPVFDRGGAHVLGTSGTVTSIAGVHLNLQRYRRDLVDGLWISRAEAVAVTERLRAMDFDARAAEPCIGVERADLVVCGCAILDALLREWPTERIRVADRGLREGILADLLEAQ